MAANMLGIVARRLSTTSATNQLVKPPIQVFSLEGRYAAALYSAAHKEKQLDAVEKELLKLQDALKKDQNFQDFINNPILKKQAKVAAMTELSKKFNFSSLSTNLLTTLADNGRMKNVDTVINAFKTIMSAHRGEIECEVTTAKPLDEALKKELESALQLFMKQGQKLLLTTKVDPSIIGGMVVSVGDKFVDMSIASKVKKYTDIISISV